jgi:hypothetical protein
VLRWQLPASFATPALSISPGSAVPNSLGGAPNPSMETPKTPMGISALTPSLSPTSLNEACCALGFGEPLIHAIRILFPSHRFF